MGYICNDIFMIRTPALPLNIAENMLDKDYHDVWTYIVENQLDNYFKESLLISTPTLYEAILRIGKDEKKDNATYVSLFKYLNRASTRTTPFGLFANVALGQFNESNNSIIKEEKIIKNICADNLWLYKLIKSLEDNQNILSNLTVTWNKSCYIYKNRVRNPHFSSYGTSENHATKKNSSIRYSDLIELIRLKSQNGIRYQEFIEFIKEKYPNVLKDKIIETVNTLIGQEYLFTDLRVPAYCEDVLLHIYNILKKYNLEDELKKKLIDIQHCFREYEKTANAEDMLNIIMCKMKSIDKTPNLIEVNSGSILLNGNLNNKIKTKLENFVNCLSLIGIDSREFSPLQEFKKQFQEEYGKNVEVPLIQVIDPSGFDGLSYYNERRFKESDREISIKNKFDTKVQEAILNEETKVIFKANDFKDIIQQKTSNVKLTYSFDMNFILVKLNNEIHITVGPNYGSTTAGKTFQRFEKVLNKSQMREYNTLYSNFEEDCIPIELREMPDLGRMSNVINCKLNYPFYLALGMPGENNTQSEITLNDIVIGLNENNKLYLKSISKNKRCKMVTDNMLNPMLNSNIFNLLRSISADYEEIKIVERLGNFLGNHYIYVPEIVIEGITISPEKWHFTENEISRDSFETFKEDFIYCCKRYKVKEYFYYCQADNRLLLKNNDIITLNILYQEYKSKKTLEICSVEEGVFNNSLIVNSKNKGFASEFVFSFKNNDKNQEIFSNVASNRLIQNNNRIFAPFDEGWVYLKIYCNKEMEDAALIFFNDYKEELKVKNFFYVRYIDETGRHIRLRIKYKSQKEALENYHHLDNLFKEMKSYSILRTWALHEYHRENNRYGGAEIISAAENVFFDNSQFIIGLIKENNMSNEQVVNETYFYAIGLFLYQLLKDKNKMFNLLDKVVDQKKERKEYKVNRKNYINILDQILNIKDKNIAIEQFTDILEDKNIQLTNDVEDIYLSLIHMCCNRLTGDRSIEEKAYSMLRHTLYDVIKRENYL